MHEDKSGLSERKKMILRAIVNAHIDKGEPVGSKYLTQNNGIDFSPATVRNEMAELEEMGYLEQPHTSAGRVPSELGYRFYVDSLMERYRLTKDELEQLNGICKDKEAELDKLIEEAGKLFSRITNYTSITVKPKPTNAKVTKFNTVLIDEHSFVLIMVMSTGVAKTKVIRTDLEIDNYTVERLSNVLNRIMADKTVEKTEYASILEMKNMLGEYDVLVDPIMKCIYETVSEIDRGDVRFERVNRLLEFPEYSNTSELKNLLGMFEQKEDIIDLISNSEKDTINIFIGKENSVDVMSNSTLIFKTITANGRPIGAIGVIGPRRMDYSKVVTTLEMLSGNITDIFKPQENNRLTDGNDGGQNG